MRRVLLLIICVMPIAASSESTWIDRRIGAGYAPDSLFMSGEYGLQPRPWGYSFWGVATPSLSRLYLNGTYKPYDFLAASLFVGRSQFYHFYKGAGLVQTPDRSKVNYENLKDFDSSKIGGWEAGYSLKFYWSTLDLFKSRFEGLVAYSGRLQWLDEVASNEFHYDPSAGALVSRRELIQEFQIFGSLRVNPEASKATRIGFLSSTRFLQSHSARIWRVGPALQTQAQNSPFGFMISMPFRIEDPYDRRPIGFFVTASYSP